MKRLLPLIGAALLIGLASAPAQEKKAGKRYALLIGVQKYSSDDLHDLEYADTDVHDLAEALKRSGYKAKDITVLSTRDKDAPPTARRIREAIKAFVGRDYAEEDVVLIAFSGHGVQAGEKFYFCPVGTTLPAADAKLGDANGLISIDELYHALKDCKAGSRLILTDCCRNNPTRAARKVREINPKALAREMPEEVTLITSCGPGQKAYEDKELGRGVFFHFVIEGLKGKADLNEDGKVTRAELEEYVRGQMRKHKSKQTPQTITKGINDPALAEVDNDVLGDVLRPVARVTREEYVYRLPYAAINANAKFAATVDGEALQLFDLEKRRVVAKVASSGNFATRGIFLQRGMLIDRVLVGGEAAAHVVHPATGKVLVTFKAKFNPTLLGTARDEKRFFLAAGGEVVVLDAAGREVEKFDQGAEKVTAAHLAGSGEKLLVGTDKGKVVVYDVDNGKQLFELEGHEKPLVAFHASKDGSQGVSLCAGGQLIRWDLEKGKKVDAADVRAGRELPYSAAFQADGRRAVVGYAEGTVGFLDIPAKGKVKLAVTYARHKTAAAVAIAADGSRAVSVAATELHLYEAPKE